MVQGSGRRRVLESAGFPKPRVSAYSPAAALPNPPGRSGAHRLEAGAKEGIHRHEKVAPQLRTLRLDGRSNVMNQAHDTGMTVAGLRGSTHRENTPMVATPSQDLMRNRNRTLAKSFYRQLKSEGFSHEQIIELSTTLLDLVSRDLQEAPRPA